VLQSLRVHQPRQDRFFYSLGSPCPPISVDPGILSVPELAVRSGVVIGSAWGQHTGQLFDCQQHAWSEASCICVCVFADELSGMTSRMGQRCAPTGENSDN
jgi:hypothetical protein